jgi:hypothetical protein
VRVRFTPEARDAARAKKAWWELNRDKAPDLFRQELAAVVAQLRVAPTEAQPYTVDRGRIIWRVMMPKTRNHVYYRVDQSAGEVEIVSVWNAVSGDEPEFDL